MEKLTKEQKMEMVSKAIDAGFYVGVSFYNIKSDEELDAKLSIFDEGLSRYLWCGNGEQRETVGIMINNDMNHEDKFEASIFLDSLKGESI